MTCIYYRQFLLFTAVNLQTPNRSLFGEPANFFLMFRVINVVVYLDSREYTFGSFLCFLPIVHILTLVKNTLTYPTRGSQSDRLLDRIQQRFINRRVLPMHELMGFLATSFPELSTSTLKQYLFRLVQSGKITYAGRGVHSLETKVRFVPVLAKEVVRLHKRIKVAFPYASSCIWHTQIVNNFSLHQAGKFYTIVEVDPDTTEAVFHLLREHYPNVLVEPDSTQLSRYAFDRPECIIVSRLVSEAPVQMVDTVTTTTLEKLVVDLFSDRELYCAYDDSELAWIVTEISEKCSVNINRMLRYARRRTKETELLAWFATHSLFSEQLAMIGKAKHD